MIKFHKITFYLTISAVMVLGTQALRAQSVRDASFCHSIKDNRCVKPIHSEAHIPISSLEKDSDGNRRLYYWGKLETDEELAISIVFVRDGKCYQNEYVNINDLKNSHASAYDTLINYLSTHTIKDGLNYLGIKEVRIFGINILVNDAEIEPSQGYRVHTYRFINCPGKYYAKLLNGDGQPLSGRNNLRVVFGEK